MEVVEPDAALDVSPALTLNYRESLGSCPLVQLAFLESVVDVQADGIRVLAEEALLSGNAIMLTKDLASIPTLDTPDPAV